MKRKKRRFRWWHVPLLLFVILLFLFVYYYISSLFLRIEYCTVEANISTPIRVVHLTDLHNEEFGTNNEKLIKLVAEQKPDVIFMTGDMLNRDEERTDIVENLIAELSKIAPVYFGYGNHESSWELNWGRDLHKVFSAAGATVL